MRDQGKLWETQLVRMARSVNVQRYVEMSLKWNLFSQGTRAVSALHAKVKSLDISYGH